MSSAVFLLSPANLNGRRAERLLDGAARHAVAAALRGPGGAPIGEVFTFISSLYFRGKLAYAERFGSPGSIFVITAGHGLVSPAWPLTRERAERQRAVSIDPRESGYRRPLERDVRGMAGSLAAGRRVVLLGSLASGKYLDVLQPIVGPALCAPRGFRSLGEMQRGSRLLRAVDSGLELEYEVLGAGEGEEV